MSIKKNKSFTMLHEDINCPERKEIFWELVSKGEKAFTGDMMSTSSTLWLADDLSNFHITDSTYITGRNEHSGSPWGRWRKLTSGGFYRTSKGNLIPYKYHIRERRFAPIGQTISLFYGDAYYRLSEEMAGAVSTAKDKMGANTIEDIYPALNFWPILWGREPIRFVENNPYMRLFRNKDAMTFTAELFGKKNYRKDLVKAIAQTEHINRVLPLSKFKNLVPMDWIIGAINSAEPGREGFYQYLTPLSVKLDDHDLYFFSLLSDRNKKVVLNELMGVSSYVSWRRLLDSARVYQMICNYGIEFSFSKYKSIVAMHNHLVEVQVRESSRMRDERFKLPIIQTNLANSLHGATFADNMAIEVAETGESMVKWGQVMNNCIASYVDSALQQKAVYGAIYNGDELIANFEIAKEGKLKQLLANHNSKLKPEVKKPIEQYLSSMNVDVSEYWGK